jgi:hypothetical protein
MVLSTIFIAHRLEIEADIGFRDVGNGWGKRKDRAQSSEGKWGTAKEGKLGQRGREKQPPKS